MEQGFGPAFSYLVVYDSLGRKINLNLNAQLKFFQEAKKPG
jgi:hypothetical protein